MTEQSAQFSRCSAGDFSSAESSSGSFVPAAAQPWTTKSKPPSGQRLARESICRRKTEGAPPSGHLGLAATRESPWRTLVVVTRCSPPKTKAEPARISPADSAFVGSGKRDLKRPEGV